MRVAIMNNKVVIDGVEIPPCPSDTPTSVASARSITIIGRKVYKDGYEWNGAKWKRTLKALWHKYM